MFRSFYKGLVILFIYSYLKYAHVYFKETQNLIQNKAMKYLNKIMKQFESILNYNAKWQKEI